MVEDLPPYMKKATPPPELTDGEEVVATIQAIDLVEGKYGQQYEFTCTLDEHGGYQTKAWVRYYEAPTPKSNLGKLCLEIEKYAGQRFTSLTEAIATLQNIGKVYLKVSGFRKYEDMDYPKLQVIPDKLPRQQKKIESPTSKANRITELILKAKSEMSQENVKDLIAIEMSNSGNMFGEETAAVLVARTLGVDLETSGVQID